MKKLISKVKVASKTFYLAVWQGYYPAVFVGVFFIILFILQWLFEYEQFYTVMIENQAGLSVFELGDFLVQALFSFFKYPDDLTPVALMLIALLQSAIVVIWIRTKEIKKAKSASMSALGIGLLGAGCVACASSLLGVLITTLGSTVSVAFVQAIGDILLVVAVLLSLIAFIDLGVKTSGYFNE